MHPGGVEGAPVVHDVVVGVPQGPLQPGQLRGAQLVDVHPLGGFGAPAGNVVVTVTDHSAERG